MYCPKCGNKLQDNQCFCNNCGYKLENNNIDIINENTFTKSKTKTSGTKKLLITIIIFVIFTFIGLIMFYWNIFWGQDELSDEKVEIYSTNYYHELPISIDGRFESTIVNNEEDALNVLEKIEKLNIKKDNLILDYKTTVNSKTFYRFSQTYHGLKVYNHDIILTVNNDGKVSSFNGYFIPDIDVNVNRENKADATDKIKEMLGDNAEIKNMEKVIYIDDDYKAFLAYNIIAYCGSDALNIIVDLENMSVLSQENLRNESENYEYTDYGLDGKEHTVMLEKYFDINSLSNSIRFYDQTRNIKINDCSLMGVVTAIFTSSLWQPVKLEENINMALNTNALTTLANFEKVYDFYKETLNYNSFDGKGKTIDACINIKDYPNASFSSFGKNFLIGNYEGESFGKALDVIGHEFTHGVINSIAGLASSPKNKNTANEHGALNEGIADVFGVFIENENWIVADKMFMVPDNLKRDLTNPANSNNPLKKGGDNYYPDSYLSDNSSETLKKFLEKNNMDNLQVYDDGGVHKNSTVISYAAYLMYKNGAFKNLNEMAKVWYQSLYYLSKYSDFYDFSISLLKASKDLNVDDSSYEIIKQALVETNILPNETFNVSGKVGSSEKALEDVTIKIYDNDGNEVLEDIKTNKNGYFSFKLDSGKYKIIFSKNGYKELEKEIDLSGNITMDVEIIKNSKKKKVSNSDENSKRCNDCYKITYYYPGIAENGCFKKLESSVYVPRDTIFDISRLNLSFNNFNVTNDGQHIYMTIGGMTIEISFINVKTGEEFSFGQPITEDTELDLAGFDSIYENEFYKMMYPQCYND